MHKQKKTITKLKHTTMRRVRCWCIKKVKNALVGIRVIMPPEKHYDMNTSTQNGTREANDWFYKEKNTAHYMIHI